mmetsp:Transcript_4434/g.10826  ORF Transcript_4434/g.10826 Transcript_4434/m.10826 type:complete len:143 (+) Transcript_4434:1-429(+)
MASSTPGVAGPKGEGRTDTIETRKFCQTHVATFGFKRWVSVITAPDSMVQARVQAAFNLHREFYGSSPGSSSDQPAPGVEDMRRGGQVVGGGGGGGGGGSRPSPHGSGGVGDIDTSKVKRGKTYFGAMSKMLGMTSSKTTKK